jgi:hypothetical protein
MMYTIYVNTKALLPFFEFILDSHIASSWDTKYFGAYLGDSEMTRYYKIEFFSFEDNIIDKFMSSELYNKNMLLSDVEPITNDIIF